MHYYIDGYNLMFRILRAGNDLQTQRQKIIYELNRKAQLLELNITLVFDAQYQMGASTRLHYDCLEILFTDQGITADDYILDQIKQVKNPQLETVITSDKKLAWLVKLRSAKTETVEEFISWLNRRSKNKILRKKTDKKEDSTPSLKTSEEVFVQPLDTSLPTSKTIPEKCFDYYLSQFEKNLQDLMVKEPSKLSDAVTKIKRKKLPKSKNLKKVKPQDGRSLEEFWLEAFQRKVLDNDTLN
jgi:predicted RNA-binding protein with PIN domain